MLGAPIPVQRPESAAHGRVRALVGKQHHLFKPIRARGFHPVPQIAQNPLLTSGGVIFRLRVADDSSLKLQFINMLRRFMRQR